MILKPRTKRCFGLLLLLGLAVPARAQAPAKPATKPAPAAGAKKSAQQPAPPAPKHYPILLIASGTEPIWSARIGMKGIERLERAGYPPIVLDPAAIEQETTGAAWLYHAKDTATSADVALRLTRENCSDGKSDTRYSFKAVVTHAQIGELRGCAKIAAEQFPEFKQKNLDDDDPDKKKVVPPPITGFKPPVASAFLDPAKKLTLLRGEVGKVVSPQGYQPSFSHDGKRLLYTETVEKNDRKLMQYDVLTGKAMELLRGPVAQAFFSPTDSTIAFLKLVGSEWQVWTMPAGSPDKAAQLGTAGVWALHGWLDAHTVLASDAAKLYFLKTEGPPTSVPITEVYGEFERNSSDTIRVSPVNSDLLLVSALTQNVKPGSPRDPGTKLGAAMFLFELKSKRRVVVSPPTVFAEEGEWSRDGMQIFFTDAANSKSLVIDRILYDGSGLKRQRAGSAMVIGQ
jgi:uncharacterized membrane protein